MNAVADAELQQEEGRVDGEQQQDARRLGQRHDEAGSDGLLATTRTERDEAVYLSCRWSTIYVSLCARRRRPLSSRSFTPDRACRNRGQVRPGRRLPPILEQVGLAANRVTGTVIDYLRVGNDLCACNSSAAIFSESPETNPAAPLFAGTSRSILTCRQTEGDKTTVDRRRVQQRSIGSRGVLQKVCPRTKQKNDHRAAPTRSLQALGHRHTSNLSISL